ncbi:MAG TPA: long-chain fatty acid--CoA ligase [Acidimicrobiales bacterium]
MNLAAIIEPHDADRIAIYSRGKPTTYGELREQVGALRGGLRDLGIGPGDRVALLFSNKRFFVDALFATLGLGAVAVPLNPSSPALEIAHQIATIGAKVVFVGPSARAAWHLVAHDQIPTIEHVISPSGHDIDGAVTLEDLLVAEPVPIVDVEPGDLAVLLFTSGTAGSPRAAMLSHGNLLANQDQMLAEGGRMEADDVVYGVLPVHHIFGLNVMLGLTLRVGATVVLVQRFDPATALETIAERKVTVVPGAPPMWLAWSHMSADPASFAGVRLALTGADKMPEEAAQVLLDRYGVVLREGYGLTEASPVVTSSSQIDPRPGSIGKPVPGQEIRLVDSDGDDVEPGDTGELWVRGPNVFKGYWHDPEATARALTPEGWLRTGDIAMQDEEGYFYIVDRAKDLIIVSGFNVFPAEVEEVLLDHPAIAETAVVGVPHPHTGEAVKAYVVLREGVVLDEEQVVAWCQDHLARYKCPNKVLFTEELPKGLGGKLLRRVLR